jgi:hypothetical protein
MSPLLGAAMIRVESEESMDVMDSSRNLWTSGSVTSLSAHGRTKSLKNYRSFQRQKNWTAHMLKEHGACLSYADYLDAFKPVDEDEKSIM